SSGRCPRSPCRGEWILRVGYGCLAGSTCGPSLAPGLLDDLLGDVPRNFRVAVELHRVDGAALGPGPQVPDVPEHLGQRHEGADDLDAARVLHRLDHATAGVEVADDVAHVLLGRAHL